MLLVFKKYSTFIFYKFNILRGLLYDYKIIEQDQKKKTKVCRPLHTKRRRGSFGSGSVAANLWN